MTPALAQDDIRTSCFPAVAAVSNQLEDEIRNRGPELEPFLLLLEEPTRCDRASRGEVAVPLLAGSSAEELVVELSSWMGRSLVSERGRLRVSDATSTLLDRPVRFDPAACPISKVEGEV